MSTPYSSRQPARRGLTLIEVVAGLALMATILVAMLELKVRFSHQLAASRQRLRGVAAADALLDRWWSNPAELPVNQSGKVPDHPEIGWQTHLIPNDVAMNLQAKVVRLEISEDSKIITSVEVLIPTVRPHAK